MAPKTPMAAYTRASETRGQEIPYEQKFAHLIEICKTAKAEGVRGIVVTWPWILGDSYEEVMESLSRIAAAELSLHVVQPEENNTDRSPSLN
jgi:hypothetical protein